MYIIAVYTETHSLCQMAWSEGQQPPGAVQHSSDEPGELCNDLCHDHSTINIDTLLILSLLLLYFFKSLVKTRVGKKIIIIIIIIIQSRESLKIEENVKMSMNLSPDANCCVIEQLNAIILVSAVSLPLKVLW